jgi:hypothetical protein
MTKVINMAEKKLQTEMVGLPSKGLLYPEDSPLRNGTVEVKYMTAKEEDILTNQSYIKSGVVIDKLLEALVVSPVDFRNILIGDKNAIMIAARVYGYGPHYVFNYTNPGTGKDEEVMVDLSLVNDKELDESLVTQPGVNLFEYELPLSGKKVAFKILSQGDEDNIQLELKNLRKMKREAELTTRLKHTIVSVDGETDNDKIREFVDDELLARDSRSLRNYIKEISPDVDLTFNFEGEDGTVVSDVQIPIGVNFFWPDLQV